MAHDYSADEHELKALRAEVEQLKAELDKFYKCDASNGCRDEFGRLHIVDTIDMSFVNIATGETMRTVWHKVDE
jgi:hypothetical protein